MSELDRVKEKVLTFILDSGNCLTSDEFDIEFASSRIEGGKRIRGSNLAFPPIWFMCQNTDKSHAFHLFALQELMKLGKVAMALDMYHVIDGRNAA